MHGVYGTHLVIFLTNFTEIFYRNQNLYNAIFISFTASTILFQIFDMLFNGNGISYPSYFTNVTGSTDHYNILRSTVSVVQYRNVTKSCHTIENQKLRKPFEIMWQFGAKYICWETFSFYSPFGTLLLTLLHSCIKLLICTLRTVDRSTQRLDLFVT